MTTLTEGNLRITFPGDMNVRKFDSPESHGLTHCMKAVDFIAEHDHRVLFIEFKDPDHPRATDGDREKFIEHLRSGGLDEDLKYRFQGVVARSTQSTPGHRAGNATKRHSRSRTIGFSIGMDRLTTSSR